MINPRKPNLNFDKIEPASLKHKAYVALQKAIIELDFEPGQLLKKSEPAPNAQAQAALLVVAKKSLLFILYSFN